MPLSSSELVVLSESTILMIVFVDYDLSLFYKVYKMLLKTLVCVCVCVRAGGRACGCGSDFRRVWCVYLSSFSSLKFFTAATEIYF